MTDNNTSSEQNPVLVASPNGQLWLFYTAQLDGNQDSAEVRRQERDEVGPSGRCISDQGLVVCAGAST